MRIAVAGKGGTGKSVVAGTLARILARRGERVLALDSDTLPGLSTSLGSGADPDVPPLSAAAERDEDGRWRLKKGIGPVRAIQRYSSLAPDGVRLLQSGKVTADGLDPAMGAVRAFHAVIHRLDQSQTLRGWSIVGDLPAGPRQIGFDWAPYAATIVVVSEPSVKSALAAKRIARIARMRNRSVMFVAGTVRDQGDVAHVERLLDEQVAVAIPYDEGIAQAERLGLAPLDHSPGSPGIRAIEGLVDRLTRG